MGVSAAMIVKNGERSIERAINSIMDAVDEIIVVDTGSTDETLSILNRLAEENEKVQLHHFTWINDFSAARNYSLSLVTHKWAFVVDDDDVLPPDQIHKPRQYTSEMDQQEREVGMYVLYKNTVNGVVNTVYERAYLRLFPSRLRYKDMIHEIVDTQGMELLQSDIDLLHDGYDNNVVDMRQKAVRNLTLLQQNLKVDQGNARLWMQLGREMKSFDPAKALHFLNRAESLTTNEGLLKWIRESKQGL
ncbi:Glycosyl transferase family 2 [Paenibacillus algorifonticola]|uniref:Glycosyl transferase family 2 n=1 Tax=Paenibacillus algorifonticola TaxID=684063 RepID=A0A1I2B296_9BACL|nr:glycosyltransferase [Paenibacillus algorifonticola]SFE50305.1 Glycosyl transferase family 2 [Paenibacillus algorifonticola]